nr:hypothetical protein CFP56_61414 [Quercus suber]
MFFGGYLSFELISWVRFRRRWVGSVPTEVGGFGWAKLWVPMDRSAMGGYGSVVLVVEAFVGCGSRFWVSGIVGRGWLRQRCGFWSGGYLSLCVDGLVGLGFWVGDWVRQLIGRGAFGWGLAGFV